MLIRRLTPLFLLAGVLVALPAQAAAPKACKLISDPKNDADDIGPLLTGGRNDPALDLVGGDIASNAKQVTTVVRVTKLAKVIPTSPLGATYYFNFSVKGVDFFTQASRIATTGDSASVGYIASLRTPLPDSSAKVVFDDKKNEIRVTFNAAQLNPQAPLKPGTKITALQVLADRYVGTGIKAPKGSPAGIPGAVLQADEASGVKGYIAGSPSCVLVGK
jgi:hypothetical protein